MLSFEGWETQTEAATRKLYGQLRDIDGNRDFTAALRIPAANLYRLLAREKTGAANEFSIIKNLESPNTWIAVPVVYPQFMTIKWEHNDHVHSVRDPELWREALGWTLALSGAVMPPIPRSALIADWT